MLFSMKESIVLESNIKIGNFHIIDFKRMRQKVLNKFIQNRIQKLLKIIDMLKIIEILGKTDLR